MDVLTDHEIAMILQRLEALATELEHDASARTFYTFVLTAHAFAETKHALSSLAHLRHCLALAHRMRAVRDALLDSSSAWHPLTTVVEVLHSDATRLSTLYGVARPGCRTVRRAQQQAFRTVFAQATGTTYHPYGHTRTAKERTAITAFWEEALHTALTCFQAAGEVDALDAVMACLPSWADRRHERWSTQGWREPSVKEVMQLVTDYLMVCEACLGSIAQIAAAAVAQAPVVERAQVAPAVEQRYAEQVHTLRDQIGAFAIPTDASRAQKAQLRREKTQLQQDLQALLNAQEAEIARHVKQGATARHKLATLVKTVSGYPDTLRRKVGKTSVDVLPRMIWIYDFERQDGRGHGLGLGLGGDIVAIRNAIVTIGARNDRGFPHLLGPPAQRRQAVFHGAWRQAPRQPGLDKPLHMTPFQILGAQLLIPQGMEFIGDEAKNMRPIGLRGIGAIFIAVSKPFEIVIEVPHHLQSGKCFCLLS